MSQDGLATPGGRTVTHLSWAFFASVATLALCTLSIILWYPIDQAALADADNAGWDTSLLLPHQFLITIVLLLTWLGSAVAVAASALALRASRRQTTVREETGSADVRA